MVFFQNDEKPLKTPFPAALAGLASEEGASFVVNLTLAILMGVELRGCMVPSSTFSFSCATFFPRLVGNGFIDISFSLYSSSDSVPFDEVSVETDTFF